MVENDSPGRLSARQKLTLSLLVNFSIVILAVMLLRPGSDDCSGIFAQTAPKLQANLEIIESRGGFAISQEKIQELSDSAQRVGLHLKPVASCCGMGNSMPPSFSSVSRGLRLTTDRSQTSRSR